MRIVINGAGGTLGTALAPLLIEAGNVPVLFDVQPLYGEYEGLCCNNIKELLEWGLPTSSISNWSLAHEPTPSGLRFSTTAIAK